jgi:predicted nuclease with TOPRIM domain
MNDVKDSVEYAHTEIKDLKTENEMHKVSTEETKQRIEKLEKENQMLINSIVDLKGEVRVQNNLG